MLLNACVTRLSLHCHYPPTHFHLLYSYILYWCRVSCLPVCTSLACLPRSPPHLPRPVYLLTTSFHTNVIHKLTLSYHFVCILYHAARDYSTQMSPTLEHKKFFSLLWPPILLGTPDPIPNPIINCTANTSSRIVCNNGPSFFCFCCYHCSVICPEKINPFVFMFVLMNLYIHWLKYS